jgi:hypothetical protein
MIDFALPPHPNVIDQVMPTKYLFIYTSKGNVCVGSSVERILTPWSRVLFEKLAGFSAIKEIPRIYGTRKFITVLTRIHNVIKHKRNNRCTHLKFRTRRSN